MARNDEIYEALEDFDPDDWLDDGEEDEEQEEFTMAESVLAEAEPPKAYSPLRKIWCKAIGKLCAPGLTSEECQGMPKDKLIRKLQKAGFYKITQEPQKDLSYRRRQLRDTVASITIEGEDHFRRHTEFPFDTKVHILYHEFKDIPVGFSPQQLKKTNVCDTKSYFKRQGFGNVKAVPICDLKMGWLKIDGQVDHVLIDGFDCFKPDSLFPVDTEITIYYHTYKKGSR